MENAVHFLTILLEDNQMLKNNQAAFLNSLVTIKAGFPKKEEETQEEYEQRWKNTSPQEINKQIIEIANNLRSYLLLVNKNFKSIIQHIDYDKDEMKKLDETYKRIETTLIPSYDDVDFYTQTINDILQEFINVKALLNVREKIDQMSGANTQYG